MPGLVRGMARTAAVVGTATATRNAVNRRQADKNAQAYAQAANNAYPTTPPPQQSAPVRRNSTFKRTMRSQSSNGLARSTPRAS